MSSHLKRISSYITGILENFTLDELVARMSPREGGAQKKVPTGYSEEQMLQRLDSSGLDETDRESLADDTSRSLNEVYSHNIENYIGTLKVPVGLVGPLRVNGLFAQGEFLLPLATTEAALVASCNRGANLITEAGGCTAMLVNEGVSRAPGFIFNNLREAGVFVVWLEGCLEEFKREVKKTTGHGALIDMAVTVEGNHVYLIFEYHTGDASGQNMVTIATEQICTYILQNTPVQPKAWFVEANLSGDKKASFQSYQAVRGKKVAAEVTIPEALIKKYLHTTPAELAEYWRLSAIGGSLSGTIGMQGHYANGLAALYLSCGQDVACVSESAIGTTRLEMTAAGDLYGSVNLPNLMVGTVGGGTSLPSQHACLNIMGLYGENKARALAEVVTALCLAGELSIMGALCSGDFTRAHRVLARKRKRK